jgi:hypothetical protein
MSTSNDLLAAHHRITVLQSLLEELLQSENFQPVGSWYERAFHTMGIWMILTDEGWEPGESKESYIQKGWEDDIRAETAPPGSPPAWSPSDPWRPIAEAPKDGTPFLACRMGELNSYFRAAGGDYVFLGGYADPPEATQWVDAAGSWLALQRPHDVWEPTHFMLLPNPPQQGGDTE